MAGLEQTLDKCWLAVLLLCSIVTADQTAAASASQAHDDQSLLTNKNLVGVGSLTAILFSFFFLRSFILSCFFLCVSSPRCVNDSELDGVIEH